MHLFLFEKRFDPRTGKELEPRREKSMNLICDYCGKVIDLDNIEESPTTDITINDVSGCEPWFSEDRKILGDDRRVDIYEFYSNQPTWHFCQNWNTQEFCEQQMLFEFADGQFKAFDEPLDVNINMLADLLSAVRYRTLRNLLKRPEYTPEMFGLEIEG